MTSAEWDAAVALAVSQPREWVVQRLAPLPLIECPVLGADGHVQDESFFFVLGLTPTDDGLSVPARASQKLVVNVARRGGVVVAAVAHGLDTSRGSIAGAERATRSTTRRPRSTTRFAPGVTVRSCSSPELSAHGRRTPRGHEE